jgi:flagella basal body P-ring formation protein FlgA
MNKAVLVLVIICASLGQRYCFGEQIEGGGEGAESSTLRIYLPREVVVKADSIQLGAIGVMQGDDASVSKARQIGLGRFALTGQQIVIDRPTILSRLASNGIKAQEVSLSGAERVTVKREEKVISGRRFAEVASAFLKTQAGYESVSDIALVRKPKDWVLADDNGEIRLMARLGKYSRKDKAKVWVGVVRDGVETGGYEVGFDLKYKRRRVVAAVDLGAGVVLGPENVKIETIMASTPEPTGWSVPYGEVAKRGIKKGAVITGNVVGPAEPPVVIKRMQTVVMKIETGGLYVSAVGVALSDGKVGQYIRVKGPNNSRIVVGKVKADGTVEPVF